MKFKSLIVLTISLVCAAFTASAAPVLTIGAGTAVQNADHLATFDSITTNTDLSNYSEDGLSITTPQLAYIDFDPTGGAGGFSGGFFYASGGVFAPYTVITLVGSAIMYGLEFTLGSGFSDDTNRGNTQFGFETSLSGTLTGTGGGSFALGSILGISDTSGFDEIRLYNSNSCCGPSFNALAMDNLSVDNTSAPVPEPSSLALLGLGMTGLAFVRRRRNAAC